LLAEEGAIVVVGFDEGVGVAEDEVVRGEGEGEVVVGGGVVDAEGEVGGVVGGVGRGEEGPGVGIWWRSGGVRGGRRCRG
jgi:hypothetical protein